jgi:hypothetical protein
VEPAGVGQRDDEGMPRDARTGNGITRRWDGQLIHVVTTHPQDGDQDRGWIRLVPTTGGWRCGWQVVDHAGAELAGTLYGDYLDAEAVLLAGPVN